MAREGLHFNEKQIKIASKMIDKLETTLDILYYFLEHKKDQTFVIVLISAKDIDLCDLLKKEKRDTDMLFKIHKEDDLYAVICQKTKVEGGYRFAERLLRKILLSNGHSVYSVALEIRTTKYSIKEAILRLIDTYFQAKAENKEGEIVFRSLY
ncbi:MAG: hypothetical protein LT067_08535 [Sulfurovum sp.]|jgi:hypothetical protein|nr:hypothetical protein [Sulfurovum sp.]